MKDFFNTHFSDAVAMMPTLDHDYFNNPSTSLLTVKCFPWSVSDKVLFLGDAAHAIVPFYGQGMNCGFEDCRILDELMDMYKDDWKTILNEYQFTRKPDADAIADLAINNFTEMREKTADPNFLLQKQIEARLHEKYPDKWIPAYTQVTFSPYIRYSEALRRGLKQEAIMQEVMRIPDIHKVWDTREIVHWIISKV